MKYIEELSPGECFVVNDKIFLLTCDFKSNGDRLCYDLSSGIPQWLSLNTIIDLEPIYRLDNNNNVIPIKKYDSQNPNIS